MTAAKASFAPYIPVNQAWLDKRKEEILEPDLPIVDPHHHLWEKPDWVYLLPDLLADLNSGHNIVSTVYLQARSMHRAGGPEELRPVGETEFVNGIAAMSESGAYGKTRICEGIVGYADLRLGVAVRRVLEAHLRITDRFRGIRHISAWDDFHGLRNPAFEMPPGLMATRGFREGFSVLQPMGLSFDAWLFHPQIDDLTSLARAFPTTPIVINHAGGPLGIGPYAGRRDEIFRTWSESIRLLATCPNVHVKLGGLGMKLNGFGFETRPQPPSSDDLVSAWKPYIETCIEAFGASRAMFESNFPVDKGSYSYAVFWNACKKLAKGLSDADRRDLFSGTAARFYRLAIA